MRTLIDIPERDLKALDDLKQRRGVSRSGLIRAAIGDYLERHLTDDESAAFGLWGDQGADGLEYQRRARAEW